MDQLNPDQKRQLDFMIAKQESDLRIIACELVIKAGLKYSKATPFVEDADAVLKFIADRKPESGILTTLR